MVNGDQCLTISRSVVILRDLRWHVEAKGKQLSPTSSEALSHMPATIESAETLKTVLQFIIYCTECEGNPDEKFHQVTTEGNSNFTLGTHSYLSTQALQLVRNVRHWSRRVLQGAQLVSNSGEP